MKTRWDTSYIGIGWGGKTSPTYTHDASLDAGHDDNEETDLD